jgi:hypothetical protein
MFARQSTFADEIVCVACIDGNGWFHLQVRFAKISFPPLSHTPFFFFP